MQASQPKHSKSRGIGLPASPYEVEAIFLLRFIEFNIDSKHEIRARGNLTHRFNHLDFAFQPRTCYRTT